MICIFKVKDMRVILRLKYLLQAKYSFSDVDWIIQDSSPVADIWYLVVNLAYIAVDISEARKPHKEIERSLESAKIMDGQKNDSVPVDLELLGIVISVIVKVLSYSLNKKLTLLKNISPKVSQSFSVRCH